MKQLCRLILSLMVILTMTLGNTFAISSAQPVHHNKAFVINKQETNNTGFSCLSNNDKPLIECDNEVEDDSNEFQCADDHFVVFEAHNLPSDLAFSSVCKSSKTQSLTILYCVFRL